METVKSPLIYHFDKTKSNIVAGDAERSSEVPLTHGVDVAAAAHKLGALLGNKGAALAEMFRLGLPVPHGFTITTEACVKFYEHGESLFPQLQSELAAAIEELESKTQRKFAGAVRPLLLSVRSGAAVSMPGMMDTILNLGLNDEVAEIMARECGDAFFAYDSYRRLIQMYASIVLKIEHYEFERKLEFFKQTHNIRNDRAMNATQLQEIVELYKNIVIEHSGQAFPQDPYLQLSSAIEAIFKSWNNMRAITYRQINGIPHDLGTAANIQAMVFGNLDENSGTGVVFTRNPSNGEAQLFGDFLTKAQGEDIVAGIRNTQALTRAGRLAHSHYVQDSSLEEALPEVFAELVNICEGLERHYRDMQDIEFTIEQGKLWILQTRKGKRTAQAAFRIASDLVNEGILAADQGFCELDPLLFHNILHNQIDPKGKWEVAARGLPASPGAACGVICLTAETAEAISKIKPVILVRPETSPEDIAGMHCAQGILTLRGGMTSHAAVIARGMGKPCVCGAHNISINSEEHYITIAGKRLEEGEIITINGSSGEIIIGEVATIRPQLEREVSQVMEWADQARVMHVRANAETEKDARTAIELGAQGIGLCRTEHMFFAPQRLVAVYKMILSDSREERLGALAELLLYQIEDFQALFSVMNGLPITIRLLDPPLHEFLINSDDKVANFCAITGKNFNYIQNKIKSLHESNPMLGHRGVRLAISFPEIYEMQLRAIFEASILFPQTHIEIMIPFVIDIAEIRILKKMIEKIALDFEENSGFKPNYSVGTMIELPAAALKIATLAPEVDFISFGTNDLTQTTLGLSRDDSKSFMEHYLDQSIFQKDPFVSLDLPAVGALIQLAVEKGRAANPKLKIGVCGEHGGDPSSIEFFHGLGLNYVSCSPYRVPVARLAAGQEAVKSGKQPQNSVLNKGKENI